MRIRNSLVALGAALVAAIALAGPAQATAFVFKTTGNDTTASSATFSSTVGGVTLGMRVTAWHATDIANNVNTDDIDPIATLGLYQAGLGVIANGDRNGADNLHEIDNLGGIDFVMLQFSQKVTLKSFGRVVFQLPDLSTPTNSDAAFWGDTGGQIAALGSSWNSAINLDPYQLSESGFTTVAGGTADSTAATGLVSGSATAASVWLVGAAFSGTRNDGFKISSVAVDTVPEPGTWNMLIAGFGLVGGSLRRRGGRTAIRA